MRRRTIFHLTLLPLAVAIAVATAAADLAAVADEWSVDLTTTGRRSGKPRTATIWFVHDGGRIYVQSGKGGETDWYKNLLKRPDVKLRFEAVAFEGTATPIDDPREVQRIHDLFLSKYWTARISSWLGGGIGTGKAVRIDVTSAPAGGPPQASGGGAAAETPPAPPPE
ncbi:MAG: nitroreductase family deazaflavin-dependent oxidoreductase [Candidatus Binatia bacterium]